MAFLIILPARLMAPSTARKPNGVPVGQPTGFARQLFLLQGVDRFGRQLEPYRAVVMRNGTRVTCPSAYSANNNPIHFIANGFIS